MTYIPITPEEEKAMLAAIGVKNVDDLFADVPPSVILKNGLNLPPGLTEPELKRFFNMIGKNNHPVSERPCFLGAGLYYHEVPSAVKAVAVATTSSFGAPPHNVKNRSTNAAPNSSLPHDLGGRAEK